MDDMTNNHGNDMAAGTEEIKEAAMPAANDEDADETAADATSDMTSKGDDATGAGIM